MNNSTFNFNASDTEALWTEHIAPYIFGVIFIIGFIGNGFLIFIIVANKAMRSVTNLLLLSLSIGDFLVIIVCLPLRVLLYINNFWYYGSFMCNMNEFIINLSQGVSIFTLTALAGDRFVAIVWPISTLGWVTKRKIITVTSFIWILAVTFALPDIITSRLIKTDFGPYCDIYGLIAKEYLGSYTLGRRLVNLIVYYVLPLVLISSMYVAIAYALYHIPSKALRNSLKLNESNVVKKQQQARKRIAKIVLILVVLFIICWTPRHVYIFVFNYFKFDSYESTVTWQLISFVFSFLNSCINPPTLYFMSSDFKRYFNHYTCGLCCKSKRMNRNRRSSEMGMTTLSANVNNHVNNLTS